MKAPSKISDHKTTVEQTTYISKDTVSMWISCKNLEFTAGQFLMIEAPGLPLRRPFVIAGNSSDLIRIIFKVRGRGTKLLASLSKGAKLKVLAPLGNPFPLPDKKSIPLLIGGGTGAITLLPLAKMLSKNHKLSILIGADTADTLLLIEEFKNFGEVRVATEDGSCGERCNVVELAEKYIDKNPGTYTLYGCGPNPMLQRLNKLSESKKSSCFVSLEERMACGVGACFCCAVETIDGIKRVCKDGPVFNSSEIKWGDAVD